MDEGKIFRARVLKKFSEEMEKFFGTRLALLVVFFYSITVGVARYYILGRSSATNFFVDLFVDSVFVGIPYLILLGIVNLLRAPYLAGKELQKELEKFEPSKIAIEEHYYHFPTPMRKAGILIKNLTNEDLDLVIELNQLKYFEYNDFDEKYEMDHLLDKDGCYFEIPKIKRKSHEVVYLAEAGDDRITFLTKKPFYMLYEFFFKRQPGEPERDFFKLWFIPVFTVKGKFKKHSFDNKYVCSMILRAFKPSQPRNQYVEIEEIAYIPEEEDNK